MLERISAQEPSSFSHLAFWNSILKADTNEGTLNSNLFQSYEEMD